MLKIALSKGRIADQAMELLIKKSYDFFDFNKDSRKLIFTDKSGEIQVNLVKAQDVPVYVERGTADLGIVGLDIILEEKYDIYILEKLKLGLCHMALAGPRDFSLDKGERVRVASKYPRIASEYFSSKNIACDIIKLNGSVELGPLTGLSQLIVDIVESGKTLEENGLIAYEKFLEISARLIANKLSYKCKYTEIEKFSENIEELKG